MKFLISTSRCRHHDIQPGRVHTQHPARMGKHERAAAAQGSKWARRGAPNDVRSTKTSATYDEAARKDYLTGFKKRKDVRRKEAATQQEALAKEERRQARVEARRETLEANRLLQHTLVLPDIFLPQRGGSGGGGGGAPAELKEEAFEDDFSRAAFGVGSVVVTTRLGGFGEEEGGAAAAAALAEESSDRLRELAAPVLAQQALRREAEGRRVEAKNRQRASEVAAKRKRKSKNARTSTDKKKGGKKPVKTKGGKRK
jgi:hypothetical protein